MTVRIIKTKEAVPGTGSFAVHHDDEITYFYYEDVASRRLRPEQMTQEQALEKAREFARRQRG